MKKKKSALLPIWAVVLLDMLAVGVGLIVFALFHHVLPRYTESAPVVLVTPVPTPTPTATPIPEEAPAIPQETEAPVVTEPGDFSLRFAEQFTDGEIIQNENEYRSGNVAVRYHTVQEEELLYHVADIYVRRIEYFRTAFAGGAYLNNKTPHSQPFADIAKANNAVAALSGDYYTARLEGVVLRNGVLYRESANESVCVIWPDGSMECIPEEEYDAAYLVEGSAWQAWAFGPVLVEEGVAIDNSRHPLTRNNPRSALGYYEPGHYCYVQVEGRIDESLGITLNGLAELMVSLGCDKAYNLDGGQSSYIYWNGALASHDFYRKSSDILYIADGWEEVEQP